MFNFDEFYQVFESIKQPSYLELFPKNILEYLHDENESIPVMQKEITQVLSLEKICSGKTFDEIFIDDVLSDLQNEFLDFNYLTNGAYSYYILGILSFCVKNETKNQKEKQILFNYLYEYFLNFKSSYFLKNFNIYSIKQLQFLARNLKEVMERNISLDISKEKITNMQYGYEYYWNMYLDD